MEFAPWSQALLMACEQGRLRAVVSDIVAAEIDAAPTPIRE